MNELHNQMYRFAPCVMIGDVLLPPNQPSRAGERLRKGVGLGESSVCLSKSPPYPLQTLLMARLL